MNATIIIILTIIIIISILAYVYITIYNKLEFSKIRVDEAQKMIETELDIRFQLIEDSKSIIKKSTRKSLSIYEEIEKLKEANINTYEYDKMITSTIDTIYVIKNDYPKINEKKEFKEIIKKLQESDTKINAAKSFYNKNNEILVGLLKKFPSNIIGKIKNIKIRPFYDAKDVFNDELNKKEEDE